MTIWFNSVNSSGRFQISGYNKSHQPIPLMAFIRSSVSASGHHVLSLTLTTSEMVTPTRPRTHKAGDWSAGSNVFSFGEKQVMQTFELKKPLRSYSKVNLLINDDSQNLHLSFSFA
jgi:hypothetical protein